MKRNICPKKYTFRITRCQYGVVIFYVLAYSPVHAAVLFKNKYFPKDSLSISESLSAGIVFWIDRYYIDDSIRYTVQLNND